MSDGEESRRQFMKEMGVALTGGAILGGAATTDPVQKALEGAGESTSDALSLAVPVASAKAASPNGSDAGQYGGGPENRGHIQSTESPVEITGQQKLHEDTQIGRPPIINENGLAAGVDYDDRKVVFADITDMEELAEVNLDQLEGTSGGEASPGMWDGQGNYIIGDGRGTYRINPETGEKQEFITGTHQGADTKRSDTATISKAEGFRAFNPTENLENYTPHDLSTGGSPLEYSAVLTDENILAGNKGGYLFAFDINEDEEIDDLNVGGLNPGISSNGEHLFATDFEEVNAFKIPKNSDEEFEKIATGSKPGNTSIHAPVVVENGDGTFGVYSADKDTGLVKGYTFDGDSMEKDWEYDFGNAVQMVGQGDAVITSGGAGIVAHNRHNGDVLFEDEDIIGHIGIPYQDKLIVGDPFDEGDQKGLYVLEMGTSDIGPDPSPQLDARWEGIPDSMTQGETVEMDFVVENNGDGAWDGDIVFEYTAGDADEEYQDSITESVPAQDALEILQQYSAPEYQGNQFSFNYNEQNDTLTVEVPTKIEDGSTENQLIGQTRS
jgi:hypothetical protein